MTKAKVVQSGARRTNVVHVRQTKGEREPTTIRLGPDLLKRIDIYARQFWPEHLPHPSRNDVLVALIERGLRDATRVRSSKAR